MSKRDHLIEELDAAEQRWKNANEEERLRILDPFLNASGKELFPRLRFDALPELLQLILGMLEMSPKFLEEIAIKEGYLDYDTRAMVNRNIAIAAIAGSINRGSTSTESSAYRRTGSTRWFKQGASAKVPPDTNNDDSGTSNW